MTIVSTSRYPPDVTSNGVDLHHARLIDFLRALQKASGAALRVFETVVFDKFGAQATGFYIFERREAFDADSEDADSRAASIWSQGAQVGNLKDFSAHVQNAPKL